MDSFSHMYGGGQFNNSSMNPMGYPAQMMTNEQMPPMPPQYARSPFSSASTKAAPVPGAQIVSSRIANDSDCGIFCHSGQTGSAAEFHVRQTIGSDGTVFVEHIPGYHVVYVAVGESLDQAVHESRLAAPAHRSASKAASRASAAASQRDRPLKPCNPFIMYRNHKITQMRKENPEINQTDISREAAKWWHNESDEVKELFRAKYREEKQVYDLKKCKRGRADSTAHDSESEAADHLSTPSSKRSRNDSLGLGSSAQRVTAKPRSRTMPNDMFGASSARGSIVTDLRKQLAARSGAAFFDATQSPYDAHGMGHHGYPDFVGSSGEASQMPSLMHHQQMHIAPLVSYSPAAMPADYTHDYGMPPVGDYNLPPVADYGADMSHVSQPEYSHMTHSLVNAGLGGAGIHMSAVEEQQQQQQGADDVTAAAAAAAADFYAAAADSIAAAAAAAAAAANSSSSVDQVGSEQYQDQQQAPQEHQLHTMYAHSYSTSHSQSPAPAPAPENAASLPASL
ncbi:hypothetical protein IWW37_004863 [Coemansia sp. RSA 2050]|nr:hypothetical protein IWW37_004863 [Coemansia sp. RSA 2050]